MAKSKSYGQVAYEGYFKACDGRSLISGQPLPDWDAQHHTIQTAWELAALAVIEKIKSGE